MFLSSLAKTSVDLGMADTAADFAQALGEFLLPTTLSYHQLYNIL
jgi:hypothetical protein